MLWIPLTRFGNARSVREVLNRVAGRFALLERKGPDLTGTSRVLLGCGQPELLEPALEATLNRVTAETLLLADALDAREDIPPGATFRTAAHAARFARALNLDPEQAWRIQQAALWRGVGKLLLDNDLLLKKNLLTYEEWLKIRTYPALGADLLIQRGLADATIAETVRHHAENYDGTGYPNGLEGQAIPFEARALRVVDVFCAMTSPRPYRGGHATVADGLEYLQQRRGSQFDPDLVDRFVAAAPDIAREWPER
ncbi:MAG TPA: HD domain-containing phosphohydrolase [Candidatus Hydrogenedentes bacterium]|nr:hypothetical protein [Candidatus Hydrogenedentota bacterium]HOK88475.1 HD domain-containing phosphohydrolase [Candidatus Hydrogenedentota bacterium]